MTRQYNKKTKIETGEAAADQVLSVSNEPMKGTKPGWRPAQRMGELKARSGYKARWCANDPANILRKKAEGWIIMKPEDSVGADLSILTDVNDGKSPGNEIRHRDMIAMMIPDSVSEERKAYYKEENSWAMKQIFRKSDDEFNSMGVQTYAPKGQSGRIVID